MYKMERSLGNNEKVTFKIFKVKDLTKDVSEDYWLDLVNSLRNASSLRKIQWILLMMLVEDFQIIKMGLYYSRSKNRV